MSDQTLDKMLIYAYADKTHEGMREDWRDFLMYLLPLLFGLENRELEDAMDEAMTNSTDILCELPPDNPTPAEVLREISGDIAAAINLEREFGLAAFHSGDMHTRVYSITRKPIHSTNAQTRWLVKFAGVQRDSDFEQVFNIWRARLETALHGAPLEESA